MKDIVSNNRRSSVFDPNNSKLMMFECIYIIVLAKSLAPIRCYRILECAGNVYDLNLRVMVKFDITNEILQMWLPIDVQNISYVYLIMLQ